MRKVTKADLPNIMLCDTDDGEPDGKCILGHCNECENSNLIYHFEDIKKRCGNEEIKFHKWETINIEGKDGQTKKCVSCVAKASTFNEFLENAEATLKPLPSHLFRAKWQLTQLEKCKDNLQENEAIVIMDYAENYSCRFQNEVQSALWDTNQVTLHPMMAYYKIRDNEQIVTKKHSVIGVSNDQKHDAHGVVVFRDQLYNKITEKKNLNMVYEWTDGAACQYKGRVGFAEISVEDRFAMQRNFFDTSHGTNVCDGLGATVKNYCHQAVISGKRVIGNARDLYEYCNERLAVSKTDNVCAFVYVDMKDIELQRKRPNVNATTVVGTQKLHSVRNTQGECTILQIRNLSCFCKECRENSDCDNAKYVEPWEERTIKLKSTPGETTKQPEPSRQMKGE